METWCPSHVRPGAGQRTAHAQAWKAWPRPSRTRVRDGERTEYHQAWLEISKFTRKEELRAAWKVCDSKFSPYIRLLTSPVPGKPHVTRSSEFHDDLSFRSASDTPQDMLLELPTMAEYSVPIVTSFELCTEPPRVHKSSDLLSLLCSQLG